MKTDGTDHTVPGNATTKGSPFVTADGWVWFQGHQIVNRPAGGFDWCEDD